LPEHVHKEKQGLQIQGRGWENRDEKHVALKVIIIIAQPLIIVFFLTVHAAWKKGLCTLYLSAVYILGIYNEIYFINYRNFPSANI
jgi:hypothetical protein